MKLIYIGQKANILPSIFLGKSLTCALASLDSPCCQILLDQSFDLDTGITADFLDQIQQQTLVGFIPAPVTKTYQRLFNPLVALVLGTDRKLY